jgi:ribonucleotide reductase beta subunit family protein with ferritin-like domain
MIRGKESGLIKGVNIKYLIPEIYFYSGFAGS